MAHLLRARHASESHPEYLREYVYNPTTGKRRLYIYHFAEGHKRLIGETTGWRPSAIAVSLAELKREGWEIYENGRWVIGDE